MANDNGIKIKSGVVRMVYTLIVLLAMVGTFAGTWAMTKEGVKENKAGIVEIREEIKEVDEKLDCSVEKTNKELSTLNILVAKQQATLEAMQKSQERIERKLDNMN